MFMRNKYLNKNTPVYRYQLGAGLIETMVSLLILGVGLMGVLSLQMNSFGSNQRAEFATEAQLLAEDMANRIYAFGAGDDGAIGGEYAAIDIEKVDPTTITPASCASGCDEAAAVEFNSNQWQENLSNSLLPNGQATVVWDPNQFYTVTVYWDELQSGADNRPNDCQDPDNDKFTDLTCYTLVVRL